MTIDFEAIFDELDGDPWITDSNGHQTRGIRHSDDFFPIPDFQDGEAWRELTTTLKTRNLYLELGEKDGGEHGDIQYLAIVEHRDAEGVR